MPRKQPSFSYSLRVSSRARHVRIAIKPYLGLEVVIPKRFPQKKIPRILQQHEEWITRQLEKHQHSLQPVDLPDCIQLSLTAEDVQISYQTDLTPRLIEQAGMLRVRHQSNDQATQLLRNWIRNRAKQLLPPMMTQIAAEFGFEFNKTSIRSQKSRWGSCSSSGAISLNDQLLFMPEETVRYLMIHELCHTRHMNHSTKFWKLVASCCADYKRHDKILSRGREKVPAWFSASLYQ